MENGYYHDPDNVYSKYYMVHNGKIVRYVKFEDWQNASADQHHNQWQCVTAFDKEGLEKIKRSRDLTEGEMGSVIKRYKELKK